MISKRSLWILALLVSACALILWGLWRFGLGGGGVAGSRSDRLLEPLPGGLDWLRIERSALQAECRRIEGAWHLVSPVEARADTARIERLLDALEQARIIDRVTAADLSDRNLNLSDFGLAPPAARLVMSSPAHRIELLLGRTLPLGGQVFVSKPPLADILLVSQEVLEAWPVAVDDLRDRRLLSGDPAALAQVEIRLPGMPFMQLERHGIRWRMTQPVAARADRAVVERWVSRLFDLRAERFVWPREGLPVSTGVMSVRERLVAHGLAEDENVLQVQLRNRGDPIGVQFRFGLQPRGDSGLHHVYGSGDGAIVGLSTNLPSLFQMDPHTFRDPHPFDLPMPRVVAFEWRAGAEHVRVARADPAARWRMETPFAEEADAPTVRAFLSGLLSLRADGLLDAVDEHREAATNGFFTVQIADARETQSLVLWPVDAETWVGAPEGQSAGFRFAPSSIPVWIPQEAHAGALLDRTVFSVFEPDIRGVRFRPAGGEWFQVRRSTAGEWTARVALPSILDPEAMEPLCFLLANLRAHRRLDLTRAVVPDAAFADPFLELEIERAGAAGEGLRLVIGAPAPQGGRYARVRGRHAVFILDDETASTLQTLPIRRLDTGLGP